MALPPGGGFSHCQTMFPSFHCSAQVCAGVQAAAQARLDEGELDRLVHSHFQGGRRPSGSGGGKSRLLQLLGQACAVASEPEPFAAFESLLRELRELRQLRVRLLSTTGEVSAAEAVAKAAKTQEQLRKLRGFERSVCASLGVSDRREAVAGLYMPCTARRTVQAPCMYHASIAWYDAYHASRWPSSARRSTCVRGCAHWLGWRVRRSRLRRRRCRWRCIAPRESVQSDTAPPRTAFTAALRTRVCA